MSTLHSILLLLHLLSMAILIGGFTSQIGTTTKAITPGQRHASLSALITGLLLVGLIEMSPTEANPLNHAKIALKLLITLSLVATTLSKRAKRPWTEGWLSTGILGLTNTCIAVLW